MRMLTRSGGGSTLGCRTSFFLRTLRMERSVSSFPSLNTACFASPSGSSNSAIARCTGLICAWPLSCASSDAALIASCVFCVNLLGSMTAICLQTQIICLRKHFLQGHLYSGELLEFSRSFWAGDNVLLDGSRRVAYSGVACSAFPFRGSAGQCRDTLPRITREKLDKHEVCISVTEVLTGPWLLYRWKLW